MTAGTPMSDAPELLPCPFCGKLASRDARNHIYETGCDNVGCSVLPSAVQLSQAAADEAWNRRATQDAAPVGTPGQFTTMCLAIEDAVTGRVFDVDPWQPIETEPKDGESVLIWKPDERMVGEYMMAAYWDDRQGGYVPVGGVHKQGYYSETAGRDQGYPTHWMPLPKPPK